MATTGNRLEQLVAEKIVHLQVPNSLVLAAPHTSPVAPGLSLPPVRSSSGSRRRKLIEMSFDHPE